MRWLKGVWMSVFLCCFGLLSLGSGMCAQAAQHESEVPGTPVEQVLKDVRKAPSMRGKWVKHGKYYSFHKRSGSLAANEFLKIKGEIYRFDDNGYRVTGWCDYQEHKYYFDKKGRMVTGWLKQTGDFRGRRFFKKNGKMASGEWIRSRGKFYYFKASGKLAKGWFTLEGKKYYLGNSGARVTGEQFIKGKWYYFDRKGVYHPEKKVDNEVNPNKPMLALTFDDGPSPFTDRLLRCLKQNNARATFFVVGSSVGNYPESVKKAFRMGCEIGNHTWNHPQLTSMDSAGILSQINSTDQAVKKATGHKTTLLRPPYGAYNSTVTSNAGVPVILWSVDTLDWKTRDVQSTINSVMGSAQDGAIILMHDLHLPTVIAAETIIPRLKKKGYQLVTVSEMAKYKKQRLHSGSVYRSIQ